MQASHPTRRLALLVEYDGAPYAGSQLQANGPSIQAELERAIEQMTGVFSRAAFAGRTDAGVHALGQVVAFDTQARYGCEEFVGGVNVRLPASICVRSARVVAAGFDPRRAALSRRYRYTIVNSATRAPLERDRAWQVADRLDLETMRDAATIFVGEHEFAGFAAADLIGRPSRRTIYEVCLRRRGRRIEITMEANAFLMHQVRRTVAALVDVGSGRTSRSELKRHLREARPGSWHRTAPARGLCLESVSYQPALFADEQEDATAAICDGSDLAGRERGAATAI
jgi:tRNA pseudouridine38-40 synthase